MHFFIFLHFQMLQQQQWQQQLLIHRAVNTAGNSLGAAKQKKFGTVWNFCNTANREGHTHTAIAAGAHCFIMYSPPTLSLSLPLSVCLPSANQLATAHKLIQFNVNFEICLCDFYVAEHSRVGSTAVMGFYMWICVSLRVWHALIKGPDCGMVYGIDCYNQLTAKA